VWKGFDSALLEDGMISWQGLLESLLTKRHLIHLLFGGANLALVVHFLLWHAGPAWRRESAGLLASAPADSWQHFIRFLAASSGLVHVRFCQLRPQYLAYLPHTPETVQAQPQRR